MGDLNYLPDDYAGPILPSLHLLQNCHVKVFDQNQYFWDIFNWRSVFDFACVVVFYSSLLASLMSIFNSEIELLELAYTISVFVVCTQTILKTSIVALNKKEIRAIIFKLGRMWRTENLSEVQINKKNVLLKMLKFCYTVFYWMNMFGSWQYMLAPSLETLFHKYVLKQNSEWLLPFSSKFPFDPTGNWFVFIGVYIFQIFSMFRIVYSYLGTEFLMITLCSHLATEFTLLAEDLITIDPQQNGDVEKLKRIIFKHQQLILLTKQLDAVFNKMIFINLLSTNITICFFGFSAKVAQGFLQMFNNFIAVIALILPLFNLCYYGELLRTSSTFMAESAYTHLWYTGNISYQKMMWLIIRRSQTPCSLTSMKYNPIALQMFTTVLSTTWSYFSLAASLYESES